MHSVRTDKSLESTLTWALGRMEEKGFVIRGPVSLSVEPKLAIMGYAKKEGQAHKIVISEWALDSEMLGGLVLHELAHIYFTERGAHSHDSQILQDSLEALREKEGLRAKETEYLIDAFNHLQNILVDDIVFTVMPERERDMAKKFFSEWVSDRPSGDPVMDASLICRNAFATASLRRRGLFEDKGDMYFRNEGFVTAMGGDAAEEFQWIERFLETSRADWKEKEFKDSIGLYFDRIVSIMRSSSRMEDLR